MNYKEALFFIGKCLTITHENKNRLEIEQKLQKGDIDWDTIVKVSTGQFVFPALYCNLKRVDFLHYLPDDLVEYMKYITNLNHERNQQLINEAKEINELLLYNNITPIFLKGTGNLLEGLYEDIAERMVGDIDLLVHKNDFDITVKALKKYGYSEKIKYFVDNTIVNRHYPKITKEHKIGAIEVHYKMITDEKYFNYDSIKLKTILKNITVLSWEDQILMTSYNKQINDKGQWYKTVSLRNSYDLYLLSKKASVKKTINSFKNPTSVLLNNFVASSNLIFSNPKTLEYTKTKKTELFLKKENEFLLKPKKLIFNKKLWNIYFFSKTTFFVVLKSFYDKKHLKYTFSKIIDFFKPNS